MRIPVLTLHFSVNYGAVLQAYATCEAIRSLGHEPEILDYVPPAFRHIYSPYRNWGLRQGVGWQRFLDRLIYVRKYLGFQQFRAKWLPLGRPLRTREDLRRYLVTSCDRVVVGSDQVWNLNFLSQSPEGTYFLDFLQRGDVVQRHSFASCFGATAQPAAMSEIITAGLKRFDSVSVRNEFSKAMVRQYAQREPALVCDPTVLCDFAQLTAARPVAEPYVLVYGTNMTPAKRLYQMALAIAEGLRQRVVVLGGGAFKLRVGDVSAGTASPQQWVAAIRDATFLLTNSFHGVHFAMKYRIPFFAVEQNEPAHRLADLLMSRGMSQRLGPWDTPVPSWAVEPLDRERVSWAEQSERSHALNVLRAICGT